MLRLFTAVEIPQFPKVLEMMEAIKRSGAEVKLVEPWNLHLTLVFIGEVRENKLDLIKDAVKSVSFNSFKVSLYGSGAFPNLNKPRVVWIGLSQGMQELRLLRSSLYKELVARGIRPEDEKEFTPHLTVGRVKGPRNLVNLLNIVNEYQSTSFGELLVDKIILFKSTLTSKGPIYEPLFEVKAIDRGGSTEINKTK